MRPYRTSQKNKRDSTICFDLKRIFRKRDSTFCFRQYVLFSTVSICVLYLYAAKTKRVEISNKLHYCTRDQRSFMLGTQRPYTVHKSSLFEVSTLLKLRGFSKRAIAIFSFKGTMSRKFWGQDTVTVCNRLRT
jgi:hypothetical protein